MQQRHAPAPVGVARRAWRVEISPSRARMTCSAPDCRGAEFPPGRPVSESALAHLAQHARRDALPCHLRTCWCRAHGCTWHPRHRGCAGPIRLVVFRQAHGRIWQLADACTGCAQAIPHSAEVHSPTLTGPAAAAPESAAGAHPAHRLCAARHPRRPHDVRAALGAALRYLDAALSPATTPGARLLALVCLLRADVTGRAYVPAGLLRGLRLAHRGDELLAELAAQRWLHPDPAPPNHPLDQARGVAVRISDLSPGASPPGAARRARRAQLDRAVRQLSRPAVRARADADRLAALHRLCDQVPGLAAPVPKGDVR